MGFYVWFYVVCIWDLGKIFILVFRYGLYMGFVRKVYMLVFR